MLKIYGVELDYGDDGSEVCDYFTKRDDAEKWRTNMQKIKNHADVNVVALELNEDFIKHQKLIDCSTCQACLKDALSKCEPPECSLCEVNLRR